MTFSGKWAIDWHGEIWGPFDSKLAADKYKVYIKGDCPQEFDVFPLWDPHFIPTVVKEYNDT